MTKPLEFKTLVKSKIKVQAGVMIRMFAYKNNGIQTTL